MSSGDELRRSILYIVKTAKSQNRKSIEIDSGIVLQLSMYLLDCDVVAETNNNEQRNREKTMSHDKKECRDFCVATGPAIRPGGPYTPREDVKPGVYWQGPAGTSVCVYFSAWRNKLTFHIDGSDAGAYAHSAAEHNGLELFRLDPLAASIGYTQR